MTVCFRMVGGLICVIFSEQMQKFHFRCDFHYPTGSDINAFDISVILNNALQNAVEEFILSIMMMTE